MVQKLYQLLLAKSSLPDIEEFRTLGQLAICDSSLFPIRLGAFWASYRKHVHALKLHLSFSLNRFLPICLLTTNGKQDDRKGLRELLEAGVTYIADRGLYCFRLAFRDHEAHGIFYYPVAQKPVLSSAAGSDGQFTG